MSPGANQGSMLEGNLLQNRDVCVICDTSSPLVCPSCTSNQQCQFIYPTSCTECSRAVCVDKAQTSSPSGSSPGPSTNVGAIVGGVVSGVAVLAIATYLIWRFCVKPRRQPIEQETWEEDEVAMKAPDVKTARVMSSRASTHTVGSIASTVLTRASNIIQIAYIPGVTNRAPASPNVLVPPVPPIPISASQASSPAATEDQHFFVPGDLRDSTYSGVSGYTDRTSYGRTSYAARSSIASTIYGKNAVIVAPAQTGMRAKPAMVSVRSANSSGTGSSTPPVPSVDFEKYQPARPPSPAGSTFSVGSTFLSSASAARATPARVVRLGGGETKQIPVAKKSAEDVASSMAKSSSEAAQTSSSETLIDDSPPQERGPFSDPAPKSPAKSTLTAVIEEATRRASYRESKTPPKVRVSSPFGDENEADD